MIKAVTEKTDLETYCNDVARRARRASEQLTTTSGALKSNWLRRSAAMLRERAGHIQEANAHDLTAAPGYGLTDAEIDRLRLTPARIEAIAVGLEDVASLPEPIGEIMHSIVRPNGLQIDKVRVPLGVVFFRYE
jgi:glutamate-5-semialdehyde dehydrogenase